MIRIEQRVTLEDVWSAKPSMIWYGAATCWWTHSEEDFHEACRLGHDPLSPPHPPLPCDPRGGMLMETDKPEEFLRKAEENAAHYGKHGLAAFMAAHHQNCRGPGQCPGSWRPWCMRTWQEYNDVLDQAPGRGGE